MTANSPWVSVITPCLDRAGYIADVIASVAAQGYDHVEHIVIDGGSKDGTQDVLRALQTTYEFRWISEPDTGMYAAINKGFKMSRGDVLAYLNTDDLYFPWTIEVAVGALLGAPRVALVYGDMVVLDQGSGDVALALYPSFDSQLLERSGILGQPTVFFRRSAWEIVGDFDETLKFVADCDYWLRMASRFPLHKVDEILAIQRNHAGTIRAGQHAALDDELQMVRSRYRREKGLKSKALLTADRFRLFFDRRVRLIRFLRAIGLQSSGSGNEGSWHRFLTEDAGFTISRLHIVLGLVPLAGRSMLFRMARDRSRD